MYNADLLVALFSLGLAAIAYFNTRGLSRLGGVFINYVLIAMVAFALIVLAKAFVKPEKIRFFKSIAERNNVLVGILFLCAYLFCLPFLGFLPASYLFYFTFNLYLGDERISPGNLMTSGSLSAIVVTLFYLIFNYFLEVPLPAGQLFAS